MWCHASSLSVNTGYSFYRERGRHTNLYIRGLPRALNEVSIFKMGWLIVQQMPRSSFNNASLVGASRPVLPSRKTNWNMRMVVVFPRCPCMWCHFLSMVYQIYNWRLGYNVALLLLYHKPTGLLCIVSAQSYLHLVSYKIESLNYFQRQILLSCKQQFYCHANNIASVKKLLLDWMLL